jgi:lysozyme family protein
LRDELTTDNKLKASILASSRDGIRGLQAALGVKIDGIFGPVTEEAFGKISVWVLIDKILKIATSASSPIQPSFMPVIHIPYPISTPNPVIPHAAEYAKYFVSMKINADRMTEIQSIAQRIGQNAARYKSVANAIAMMYWPLIGIIHNLESGMNFNTHLCNGDPLTERTVHNPVGRPTTGEPPFTWESSAVDALKHEEWDIWHDWMILGMAYISEMYNGMGYRSHGIPSPYLWAGSSIYVKGAYTSDGNFDPNAVSREIGVMTMLKYFYDQGSNGNQEIMSNKNEA